jgi:prefoldin subunit 5
MEATEIADQLTEGHDQAHEQHEAHHTVSNDSFRKRVGAYIGLLAALLAITSLGGGYAMKETINNNIQVSDNYAFYQARNARETATELAADELDSLLLSRPDLPAEAVAAIKTKIENYHRSIEHFESNPAVGDGKKELMEKAQELSAKRDAAQSRDINFDFAEALLQIAIVIASTSILSASRPLLAVSVIAAGIAICLSLNGFFLLVELPFPS